MSLAFDPFLVDHGLTLGSCLKVSRNLSASIKLSLTCFLSQHFSFVGLWLSGRFVFLSLPPHYLTETCSPSVTWPVLYNALSCHGDALVWPVSVIRSLCRPFRFLLKIIAGISRGSHLLGDKQGHLDAVADLAPQIRCLGFLSLAVQCSLLLDPLSSWLFLS